MPSLPSEWMQRFLVTALRAERRRRLGAGPRRPLRRVRRAEPDSRTERDQRQRPTGRAELSPLRARVFERARPRSRPHPVPACSASRSPRRRRSPGRSALGVYIPPIHNSRFPRWQEIPLTIPGCAIGVGLVWCVVALVRLPGERRVRRRARGARAAAFGAWDQPPPQGPVRGAFGAPDLAFSQWLEHMLKLDNLVES